MRPIPAPCPAPRQAGRVSRRIRLLRFLLVAFALAPPAFGQPVFYGARNAALGGTSAALPDDAAGQGNPAAWAQANERIAALHGAQLYGLPELRFAAARFVAPVRAGAVSAGVSTFGFDLYRHIAADAGYARSIGFGAHRNAWAGLRAEWNAAHIANYGQPGALSLTAGVLFPVTPFVALGAVAYRLASFAGPLRSDLPRRLAAGVSWNPSPAFLVAADAAKEIRSPLAVSAGVEIRMAEVLVLRGGFASGPRRTSGGVGLLFASMRADFAVQKHYALGWTPSMSLLYSW